jgi:hypothetical protein
VCFSDGACGSIETSAAVATSSGAWSKGSLVTMTRGVQASFSISITQGSLGGLTCDVKVNGAICSCVMKQCDASSTNSGVQADCTNLAQGTLDTCDTVILESPARSSGTLLRTLALAECPGKLRLGPRPKPTCRANGAKCTSPGQCCGRACDGSKPSSRSCKACKKRLAICSRPSQWCSRNCRNRRCA